MEVDIFKLFSFEIEGLSNNDIFCGIINNMTGMFEFEDIK